MKGKIISSVDNGCSTFFFSYFEKMSSVSILPYGKSPGGVAVWSEKQPHRLGIGALPFHLLEQFGED